MWQRVSRIVPWLLFLMAPVFWSISADFAWTLVPLFSMACLVVVQARIRKQRPGAVKLNVVLAALVLAFNIALLISPEAIDEVPEGARSLWNQKRSADRTAVVNIDPAAREAREFLRKYTIATPDAEAKELVREFAKLAEQARRGALDQAEKRRQKALLARYRRWAKRAGHTVPGGEPPPANDAGGRTQ